MVCVCVARRRTHEIRTAQSDVRLLLHPAGAASGKPEVEVCHQTLIDRLDKPERKLVLQIIDAKDRIAEDISIDSFISGFELAWKLSAELNHYENERSVSRRMALGPDARFTCKKEEE